ncbi:hypothetical protein EG329_002572 [Mollisiaceae sp. DMI_Dod_QoI]|nr:hypothetical protein EG329_002572 [Helotiales sp. DMI_Dod_QoI]
MGNALSPVRGVKNRFSNIYNSHLKDQDRASKINRIWTTIFGLLSLGLGIAFLVSCSSSTASTTHLVSVNTTQLIWDITTNNTFVNDTSNAAREDLLITFQEYQTQTPGQYLFGFSGCCRVYANGSKHCIKAFPQSLDILTTILTDINALSNSSDTIDAVSLRGPNFASMQSSYISTSKAYTAVITTAFVWTIIATIFINIFASKSLYHLYFTIPGVILAVGSTAVFTWCIVIQLGAYELSENYAAISFGPGAFLLWVWMICVMLLTPLTAMISIIVVLALFLVMLWIAFLCAICVLAMAAGAGGGNQNDQDQYPYPPYDQNQNYPPDY